LTPDLPPTPTQHTTRRGARLDGFTALGRPWTLDSNDATLDATLDPQIDANLARDECDLERVRRFEFIAEVFEAES
jgi:hypothetical protein